MTVLQNVLRKQSPHPPTHRPISLPRVASSGNGRNGSGGGSSSSSSSSSSNNNSNSPQEGIHEAEKIGLGAGGCMTVLQNVLRKQSPHPPTHRPISLPRVA